MTNWTPGSDTATAWAKTSTNSTDYTDGQVILLGAIMDDTAYKMDDSTLTISDTKVSSYTAPPVSWTES